ncbi:YrhC family protein [Anaerobacillus sp. MEB173]|uniref:YrhC family protein n=1 Tax=Anaerobacillus sp. MEB173 TaxID=3383345 RepID=UPI003F937FB0
MNEDRVKQLTEKVNDYKRFSYILIALSVFLFLGLIIPAEGNMGNDITLIGGSLLLLGFAFACHRIAMKSREQLEEE